MIKLLSGLAVVVVVMVTIPILLSWSRSRRRLRVERNGGAAVLRMPRGHWAILAVIAILSFATISTTAFLVAWQPGAEADGWILGGGMALAGLIAGGYLVALEVRGSIRLDDAHILKTGAVRRRMVAWGEVVRITFNPVNNWFFVTGPGGKTIYFGEGLDGLGTFAEYALRRLPPKVLEASPEAEEALEELARS